MGEARKSMLHDQELTGVDDNGLVIAELDGDRQSFEVLVTRL